MIRPAPICLAESTPSRPTAPSPTTATVLPGFLIRGDIDSQEAQDGQGDRREGILKGL
jgi:hypothetical protein